MKTMKYTRKNNVITDYTGQKPTTQSYTCNGARRKSHQLQMYYDGALGLGTVRVIR